MSNDPTEADILIDGLGGTSAVAEMTKAPASTVHSWRKKGFSLSRKEHLRLLYERQGIRWPLDPLAHAHATEAAE